MNLSVGIVGLPNVGKSTLFNALLKQQQALAANYPFATIEPNVGIVPVPDERLDVLAKIVKTSTIKPATIEFVDIAGLVKGASAGEGLGNQFLGHIRETQVICHVLRDFEDEGIIREGAVSPEEDLQTVRMELQLADLQTLSKQQEPKGAVERAVKERWEVLRGFQHALEDGEMVYAVLQSKELKEKYSLQHFEQAVLDTVAHELFLLTAKRELFVINVSEKKLEAGLGELQAEFAKRLGVTQEQVLVMCNKIESELSALADEDRLLYLQDLGLEASGLDRLISAAYEMLGLQSFLTAGEKEVRAWTIPQGTTARRAAGVIHTDFERLMISAKVCTYDDFVKYAGWKGVKEAGKMRTEGREYVMRDADIVEFLIGK